MPGKDKVGSLADLPLIQGEFEAITGYLVNLKKQIQGFDAKIDFAKGMDFKQAAGAAEEFNKTQKEAISIQSDLLKVQILQEKQLKAKADAQRAETALRVANEKAAKAEAAEIKKRDEAALKYQNDLNKKLEAARAGVKPDVPFTVNDNGEKFNPNAKNAPTAEQVAEVNDLTEANIEYAKAEEGATVATEANAAAQEGAIVTEEAYGAAVTFGNSSLEDAILRKTELEAVSAELSAQQERDALLYSEGIITLAEYNNRILATNASLEKNKIALQQVGKEIKAHAVLESEESGVLEKLRAKLVLLNLEYDKLNKNEQLNTVAGRNVIAQTKAVTQEINTQRQKVGDYTKNVGNYANGVYGGIRKLAQILPGIGIAGIFALIFEGLTNALEALHLYETQQEQTNKSIDKMTGIANTTKEALKGMGETFLGITKNSLKEVNSEIDKINAGLNLLPTTMEKAQAATKALSDQTEEYKDVLRNATKLDLLNPVKIAALLFAKFRIKQNTEAIKEQTVAQEGLNYALEQQEHKLQAIAIFNREQQRIKDQQAGNDLDAAAARAQFSTKNNALTENFKLENELIENQHKKEIEDANHVFSKEFEADTKYHSALLNNKKKFLSASLKLDDEYAERFRKAALAEQLIIINDQVSENSKVLEDQNNLYDVRIDALKRFGLASGKLLDEQQKDELAKLGLTPKEIEVIYEKYNDNRVKLAKELAEKLYQIHLQELNNELQQPEKVLSDQTRFNNERIDAIKESYYIQNKILDEQYEHEIAATELTEKEKFDIAVKYQAKHVALSQEQNKKTFEVVGLKEGMDKANAELNKLDFNGDHIKQLFAHLFPIEAGDTIDSYVDKIEKLTKAFGELGSEVTGGIFDIFTNNIQRQQNAVQDLIDKLDEQKQKDLEVANASIANADDRAAAIASINARAEAQKTILEKRQRDLEERKARFEKAASILAAISNTAQGITAAVTSKPPNLILAGVIGAIGLIQIARIAAAPIPHYKYGGTHKVAGPGVVGDGGRHEGLLFPDGSIMKSAATSTLMDLPEGTQIFPDWNKFIRQMPDGVEKQGQDPTKAIEKIGKNIVQAIKTQPRDTYIAEGRYKKMTQKNSTFMQSLNL